MAGGGGAPGLSTQFSPEESWLAASMFVASTNTLDWNTELPCETQIKVGPGLGALPFLTTGGVISDSSPRPEAAGDVM